MTVHFKYTVSPNGLIELYSTSNTDKTDLLESDRIALLHEATKVINELTYMDGVYLESHFDLEILDAAGGIERVVNCVVSLNRSIDVL